MDWCRPHAARGAGHEATARLTDPLGARSQGPGCQPDRTGGRAQRWSTAPCSARARPCARRNGGPAAAAPRRGPGEERVDPSDHGVAVRPLPNSALVFACVESSATTASAHGPERAPDRPDEAQFAMRALHRAPQSPAADQPRSIRSSAICEVRSGLLPGSGGPQDVDQRSPCPPAHGAQNAQIWTASVLMGIEPTPAQIGGSVRVLSDLTYHSA